MLKKVLFYSFFFVTIASTLVCHAEERMGYITDTFEVTARLGPSNDRKILAMLKSGSPVKILEDDDSGWSKVLIKDNKEAWVLTRYILTDRKPWLLQAEFLEQENDNIKQELNKLTSNQDSAVGQAIALDSDLKDTREELQKITALYDELRKDSSGYMELKEKFTQTCTSLDNVINELSALKAANGQLNQSMEWFAVGAIVILFGFLIGLLVGRQNKKRSYY